jgi:solute carrier family 35 protein C2
MAVAYTGALTLCVVGVVKLIFLIAMSTAVGGYELNPVNEVGLVFSVLGVVLYNYMRIARLRREAHTEVVDVVGGARPRSGHDSPHEQGDEVDETTGILSEGPHHRHSSGGDVIAVNDLETEAERDARGA